MPDVPAAPPIRVLAHRGASARWPEHTRAAYAQALADGADGLECDVRLSSDGVPVCWHDADVDRTSDGTGPVHGLTLAQLRSLDVVTWATGRVSEPAATLQRARDARPQLLTLAELVELARGAGRPVHLAIELKHPVPYGYAAEDAVLAVLRAAGWDRATGTIGAIGTLTLDLMSFHPGSLEHLASAGRDVPPARLMVLLDDADLEAVVKGHSPGVDPSAPVVAAVRRLVARAFEMAATGAVGGVGPGVGLLRRRPDLVRGWVAAGSLVRGWTVDEENDLALCQRLGVAEVTSNVPDRLLGLLGRDRARRGAPPAS